jgi:hypothetical protein
MPNGTAETKKDKWDVMTAVGTLIGSLGIPILVVWLGWWLPAKAAQAQQAADALGRERELAATEVSARVAKATVIPALMDGLLSTEAPRRKMAIFAILIALPAEGPDLIRQLELTADSEQVRVEAATALRERQVQLVNGVFAKDPSLRLRSQQALIDGYHADPEMARNLVARAQAPGVSEEAVQSATAVVGALSEGAVAPNRQTVDRFLGSAAVQKAAPAKSRQLQQRLPPPR